MCGIVGVCNLNGEAVSPGLLQRMTDVIAHRGPDGEGHYTDGPVGFGHRRLAIIDLSPAGHQPMASKTGDVVITYNGEIYNFQKLRVELEALGHGFHSKTDTEVVIHAYETWGEECVHRFNGIFAFAIWDRRRQRIFLARDRFGVKPLYWYFAHGVLIFASEIKSILEHPTVRKQVCYPALNNYFTFQNNFGGLTLFEGVQLLMPGCTLSLDMHEKQEPAIREYWDFPSSPKMLDISMEECQTEVLRLFTQAVTRQLVSDVPVGAYLSGGMDSGAITAVAVRHLSHLATFTCGFDLSSAAGLELGFDERPDAEALSNFFKTEHFEVILHAGHMEWALPELIWHLEDLRVGQSYPNYYVARLSSRFVKVVLSGAGGDELFAGYPWRYYRGLNSASRHEYFERYYQFWQRLVPEEDRLLLFNDFALKQMSGHSTFDAFREVFSGWQGEFHTPEDYINASLYFELKTFLHGLLVVEDKLSMAHSLETRVPFLDHDLVDFAVRVPARYKLRTLEKVARVDENVVWKDVLNEIETRDGKTVLRKAMSKLIPSEITNRVKQGFSAPDASWFRGESIDYIERFLRDPHARIYEFLKMDYVARVLDDHCSGKVNRRLLIWSLLSFEWWLRKFL